MTRSTLAGGLLASLLLLAGPALAAGRTIVLGFDGMDPGLAEAWMAEGRLPSFAKLREQGHYQPLPTTNPAQSPVAWSSFATGLDPGAHGIFDFLSRDPATYGPDYSIATVEPPRHVLKAFGYQLPLDTGSVRNRRVGTPFWTSAEREGHPASVLRVPVTYPPDPITRMLSGMGVPDLLGTQGTFTLYTTAQVTPETTGGRQIQVTPSAGRVATSFAGPPDPFRAEPEPLTVPLLIEPGAQGEGVRVTLDGTSVELAPAAWSDWVPVRFTFAGFLGVRGMVRLHLTRGFPDLELYVSPIHIDPREPAVPISSPNGYAADLAARIGLFHTIGMPEETWALNEGKLGDEAWLDMEATILKEREAMLFDTLERQKDGLVVMVFVQTDRVSHMFWRGLDTAHPLHAATGERGRAAIPWIYAEADRILGRTLAAMGPEDRLIVLSDHGFAPWRRSVHLNRWLVENGFMATKPGQPAAEQLFANVNWPRTQAYAIGLNDIFLNRRGREALGIVRDEDAAAVKRAIIEKLEAAVDPETGERLVLKVHDAATLYAGKMMHDAPDLVVGYAPGYRASWQTALGGVPAPLVVPNDRKWSGDHCIEPSRVPGVLFTSFKVAQPVASIAAVPTLIGATLGLTGRIDPVRTAGSRGYLGIAAPVLDPIDRSLAGWLPPVARVTAWTLAAAFLALAIAGLGRRRRGLSWLAWLVALVPLVLVLAWLAATFDARPPAPGERVAVTLVPGPGQTLPPVSWQGDAAGPPPVETAPGRWEVSWPGEGRTLSLLDSDGARLLTLPTAVPASEIAQRDGWHGLLGNPAGYLPSPGPIAAVRLDLPRPEILPFGPAWLRGWLPWSLLLLVAFLIAVKFYRRTARSDAARSYAVK